MTRKAFTMLAAFAVAACQSEPSTAVANAASPSAGSAAALNDVAQPQAPARVGAPQRGAMRLSGPPSNDAIGAVRAEAARQKMTRVRISAAQSFTVVEDGRPVATLVTGEGNLPSAELNGCFVAMRQGGEVMLIPTLGYGEYELEPCGGPLAVGVLSSGSTTKLGVMFRSYSRDSEQTVPIVINWYRTDNTLLIDEDASRRALDGGAKTIAQMRRFND